MTSSPAHGTGGGAAGTVLALCGGIGGAKLALGLYRVLAPGQLIVVVNTGDDFEHLGLHVSPDVDTVLYTLAGCNNPATGWGRAGETGGFMAALQALGGESWFFLDDGDLATHVERTRRLAAGETLSEIAKAFSERLGIAATIAPMTDDPVRTVVETADGPLPFQHYFVRERCEPAVSGFRFEGAALARPGPDLLRSLGDPDLGAVIVCPSNPFISIDPILALPGVRRALGAAPAPVIAVSPIVGGRAIKGPTAKIMTELGLPCTAVAVAGHYGALLDGFVLDRADAASAETVRRLGIDVLVTNTVMRTLDDRIDLARAVLGFAARLARVPLRSAG